MATAKDILKQYWGYDAFRGNQESIIIDVLDGKDILALMPTGGGKSLCYQVPAIAMDGMCLVVSPLVALMQDQVARLKGIGIGAACIHAGMSYNAVKHLLQNAMHGVYKLLYVSPERLQSDQFNEFLPELDISFIAVDEAHCVSQWGHDFRPDYLKITSLREVFRDVPILALTATATTSVQNDIAIQLQLRQPLLYTQSFERKNIEYVVSYSENKNPALLCLLQNSRSSNIIYCRSRRQTEVLVKYLAQEQLPAVAYHAGMAKDKRNAAQEAWMRNSVPTIVATTAFGMGIDKPDVELVVNYDAPEHLEAYYQEAGRAGRNGQASKSVILYNNTDINRLQRSTDILFPSAEHLRHVYQCVAEYLQIAIGTEPYRYYDFELKDFCEKFKLDASVASSALKLLEQEGLWTLTDAVFSPPTIFINASRTELDEVINAYPELGYTITTLLRLYGSLFQYPTAIRLFAIARQMKCKMDDAEKILNRLDAMGIIEYAKQKDGPQMFFHHYRVDSKQLIIDTNRINKLKKRHEERTLAMINYLENDRICRSKIMLVYFDEELKQACGHCDVCLNNQSKVIDNQHLIDSVLGLLSEPIHSAAIITSLPDYSRDKIISAIRSMADEKIILIEANGFIRKL